MILKFDNPEPEDPAPMPLGTEIAGHLPYLRRYARALTGNQIEGDRLVRILLESALADHTRRDSLRAGRVALYRAFTEVWRSTYAGGGEGGNRGENSGAQTLLARVTPASREALLLITLEEFSLTDTAYIMSLDHGHVAELLHAAEAEIACGLASCVLIIEDEPLIAMQIEEIARSLGHTLCGTAATRAQARAIAENCLAQGRPPGLVLADVRLADGSSGLDAVDDVLAMMPVPVIFITAFPERLLTGDREEPTWLVTKPFREEALRAVITQALFCAGQAG